MEKSPSWIRPSEPRTLFGIKTLQPEIPEAGSRVETAILLRNRRSLEEARLEAEYRKARALITLRHHAIRTQ
jgi:hypothetical protein